MVCFVILLIAGLPISSALKPMISSRALPGAIAEHEPVSPTPKSLAIVIAAFTLSSVIFPHASYSAPPSIYKKTSQTAEELIEAQTDNLRTRALGVSNELLANPFLENYRINTQANVDVNKDSDMALFLIPILKLEKSLNYVGQQLEKAQTNALTGKPYRDTKTLLSDGLEVISKDKAGYEVKALKAIFNRYSDNIFYTDKREANLYLQGGTSPGSAQTTAYLYRNQIITAIDNLQQDLNAMLSDAQIEEGKDTAEINQTFVDTLDDLREAKQYMNKYLAIVDAADLTRAKAALKVSLK